MTDRVLLSASQANIRACVELALEHGLGIEIMAFAYPNLLDGHWRATIAEYKTLLAPVQGMLTMHGPFMDMAPGSPDQRINQVVTERYQHAIRIAAELGVEVVVFHANFLVAITSEAFRHDWQRRNVAFWGDMARYARQHDVTVAIENMWEFDPDIIGDVVKGVNHPNLRACLDVGHARLFSRLSFEHWLEQLGPLLVHTHLNNNNGFEDVHQGFDDGVMDYSYILQRLRELDHPPTMTLEMDSVDAMRASLKYLHLPDTAHVWHHRIVND